MNPEATEQSVVDKTVSKIEVLLHSLPSGSSIAEAKRSLGTVQAIMKLVQGLGREASRQPEGE